MTAGVEAGRRDRASAAEQAADGLRQRITAGALAPGSRLSEESIVGELGVSRNTLREAFRLLTHEGLLVYRLNRGVFVPELTPTEIADLYRLRRAIECEAVRSLSDLSDDRLRPLYETVWEAERAAGQGRWLDAGTANMHFHRHLVALAGSPRFNATEQRLLAELRLAFHSAETPRSFHEPYISRNRELADLLASGDCERAAAQLETYLFDSEEQLLGLRSASTS